METENKLMTIESTMRAKFEANGLQIFNLAGVNDIETLSAVALYSVEISGKTQLAQAKAISRIRDIFTKAKEDNSARNKAKQKYEPKSKVNIYGCETFTEYAETKLHIPKSTANTLCNLARMLDETGLHSVWYGRFGEIDFGFAQLLKISPYYKVDGEMVSDPVETFNLDPSMTVKKIAEKLSGKGQDISADVEIVDNGAQKVEDKAEKVEDKAEKVENNTKKADSKSEKVSAQSVTLAPSAWLEIIALLRSVNKQDETAIAIAIENQLKK